jgi:hypothetical protein
MRFRKLTTAVMMAAMLFVLPRMAEAQAPQRNRGLDITLGLGMAGCTDLGCAGFDMSAHVRMQLLYRVVRYFAVGAHMGFQFLSPDRNSERWVDLGWSTVIGPEVRGILPVGPLEAWLGFTTGYMRIQVDQENDDQNHYDVEWANGFALGFGFGAQYFVHRRVAIGLDFWLYKGFFNEACVLENDLNGSVETCTELDDDGRAGIGVVFTFGLNVTFFIPM